MLNVAEKNKFHHSLELDSIPNPEPPKWLAMVLASSWFIGLLLLFWIYSNTNISFTEILKWFAFFSLIFTLIPYKWMVKILPIDYTFMIVVNVMGLGPSFTSIFLILNMIFSTGAVTESYKIEHYYYGEGFSKNETIIRLENHALEDMEKFRSFDPAYRPKIQESETFTITISNGLFGYQVLEDYKFE
jgi:hypothetical protein